MYWSSASLESQDCFVPEIFQSVNLAEKEEGYMRDSFYSKICNVNLTACMLHSKTEHHKLQEMNFKVDFKLKWYVVIRMSDCSVCLSYGLLYNLFVCLMFSVNL